MAKPAIKKILPFDADKPQTISIVWMGGRVYGNKIIIQDSQTLENVFTDTVSSLSLTHTIPAGALKNGKKYTIQCQIIDEESQYSVLSDKVYFYTFKTPDFYFYNLPENKEITSSSLYTVIYYYSEDWENISNYKFYLYDYTKRLLNESDTLFDDVLIKYTYNGLDNNSRYYIRCQGTTVNGMLLDTGYVEINVKYEEQNVYSRLYLTNKPKQGCITAKTNLIIINYDGTDDFEYRDSMINLIDKTLVYDEGFLIDGDFTLILRGIRLWQTAEILKMSNDNLGLSLSSRIYNDGQLRFKLQVPSGVNTYLLYSEPEVFSPEDMVTIFIRRKNDVYQLKTLLEINFNPEGNMWYGFMRPSSDAEKYDCWINTNDITYKVDKMKKYIEPKEPIAPKKDDLWIGGT